MKCWYQNTKYILICIFSISWTVDAGPQIDLGQIMQQFVRPFLVNPRLKIIDTRRASKSKLVTSLETVITKKIEELKDLLQDNDKIEAKQEIDRDETTIIEFYPKPPKTGLRSERNRSLSSYNETAPFTVDVEKYKKIKQKIDTILAKETLTDDGKKIIKNAFEDIVGKLLKNQCTWKSVIETPKTRRSEETNEGAMETWRNQFDILKKKYFQVLKQTEAPVSIEDLIQIFEGFNDFFSQIMNDINGMSKRYEIKCKLIDKKRKLQYSPLGHKPPATGNKHFRVQSLGDHTGTCKNVRICSAEFTEFLKYFYIKLNDTICSAFKNYAAMYDRDVNTDNSEEGTLVTEIVNKTGDALEIKLEKIYKRKVQAIILDPNKDKQKNVKIIKDFINKVIESLNETINKALDKDFSRLSHKIQESVKRDVSINMGIELSNLQRITVEKVCSMFEQCNGLTGRRSFDGGSENIDDNLVFVQLRVNVTDENLARAAKNFLRSHNGSPIEHSHEDYSNSNPTRDGDMKNDYTKDDQTKNDHSNKKHDDSTQHKVTVTRTTTLKSSNAHYRGTRIMSD